MEEELISLPINLSATLKSNEVGETKMGAGVLPRLSSQATLRRYHQPLE